MSAVVDSKAFAAAVAHAQRALSPRPPRAEYAALPLTVSRGELSLSGYDGRVLARVYLDARGDLPTVYPYGTGLGRVASRLTGEATLTEEGSSLVLHGGGGRQFAVDLLPDGLYPSTPGLPPAVGDAPGFAEALRYVIESAGRDETVPALTGVRLVASDGRLAMQATNRYELSRAVVPWDGLDFDVFVQAKMLGDFLRSMSNAALIVHADDRRFGLSAGSLSASFPIADGGFDAQGTSKMIDNARKLALSDEGGVLIVRRETLLEAVKDMEQVLDDNDPVLFRLDPDEGVHLIARGSGGSRARGALPLQSTYVGPPMEVKIKYLGCLTRVPSPYVNLGFFSPIKPVHVAGQREEDSEDIDTGVQHIAMPLRGN